MELIKKIKQTEAQAQEIIEQAKTQAAGQTEQGRERRLEALAQAEQERKKTVEAAVAAAQAQAVAEIDKLKTQAEKDRQSLHNKANAKMAATIAKVMDYIRG